MSASRLLADDSAAMESNKEIYSNKTSLSTSGKLARAATAVAVLGLVLAVVVVVHQVEVDQHVIDQHVINDHVIDDHVVVESSNEVKLSPIHARRARLREEFQRRFPRHQPIFEAQIQPKVDYEKDKKSFDDNKSSSSSKVLEILALADTNHDNKAYAWELFDWMEFIERKVYEHWAKEQWYNDLGRNGTDDVISWADYRSLVNPGGIRTEADRRRRDRELRRWRLADENSDQMLTWDEFHVFAFPQMSTDADERVLGPEAFEDLDKDRDNHVDLQEFLSIHEEGQREQAKIMFQDTLDADESGWLDLSELFDWLRPSGFVAAMSETALLIEKLDKNDDLSIDASEIIFDEDNTNLFLNSQLTFFGQLYQIQGLREEVLQQRKP